MSLQPTEAGSNAGGNSVTTNLREFLAFKLGAEEYGIDILRVQEIRSYEEPTRIANAPPFIKGVVNLRGVIVPIIDMRMKFNLEQANYDDFTVVIVLNIGTASWAWWWMPSATSSRSSRTSCARCPNSARRSPATTSWPSARSKTAC
jgi:hypothetical protein